MKGKAKEEALYMHKVHTIIPKRDFKGGIFCVIIGGALIPIFKDNLSVLAFFGVILLIIGGFLLIGSISQVIGVKMKYRKFMNKLKKIASDINHSIKKGDPNSSWSIKLQLNTKTDELKYVLCYDTKMVKIIDGSFDGAVRAKVDGMVREIQMDGLVDLINRKLDMEFPQINDRNNRAKDKYYDEHEIPRVDVDNLDSPFVELGGVTPPTPDQDLVDEIEEVPHTRM